VHVVTKPGVFTLGTLKISILFMREQKMYYWSWPGRFEWKSVCI